MRSFSMNHTMCSITETEAHGHLLRTDVINSCLPSLDPWILSQLNDIYSKDND